MKEGYVTINHVPTHIMTWGHWIEDKLSENVKQVIVVVTGNPGLPGYYTEFCNTLYDELDKEIPIWVIGHAGHDEPKSDLKLVVPALKGNHDLYNVQGQVNHKIDFLSKYVPAGVKVHLVSHSIGSKISLELLKVYSISSKIHQCYLLFPTIERMVTSYNGFWFYKIFNRIYFFLRLFYYAFSFLPLIVRTLLLYIFCYCSGYPAYFLGTVIKTSSPTALDKIWFMSQDEMETVCAIDDEIIDKNQHRLKFYYGMKDGWVPGDAYRKLIERFPGIDAELCQRSIEHGFVVSHGATMARMLSEWIVRKKIK